MRGWEKELEGKFQKGFHASVECGDGWRDIILNLVCALDKTEITYKICQVKEKFGGLRFYVDFDPEQEVSEARVNAFHKLISDAEDLSITTCEACGKPGDQTTDGYWIKTLCPEDAAKRAKK